MTDDTAPTRRGRPRSGVARRAILDAAADLLLEGGLTAATMEGIAARAGVSKATIYKWWPSRGAVALEGFLERVKESIAIDDDAPTDVALGIQMERLVDLCRAAPTGTILRAVVAQAQSDPEIAEALRTQWLAPRRNVARRALTRGVERGDLRADLDVDVAIDQLFGPVYYRLVFGHAAVTRAVGRTLLQQFLDGASTAATPAARR